MLPMHRLLPAVALCVALAGCQPQSQATDPPSTTPSTQPSPTTTTTLGVAESTVAFTDCLADHQVVPSELDAGGADVLALAASMLDTTDPAVRAAIGDCAPLLTPAQIARLSSDFEVRELVAEHLDRFSECMRAEGIADFPDPVVDPVPGYDLELVPFDADGFDLAVETCGAPIGSFGIEE